MNSKEVPTRNIALELVRVTEAAALAGDDGLVRATKIKQIKRPLMLCVLS